MDSNILACPCHIVIMYSGENGSLVSGVEQVVGWFIYQVLSSEQPPIVKVWFPGNDVSI